MMLDTPLFPEAHLKGLFFHIKRSRLLPADQLNSNLGSILTLLTAIPLAPFTFTLFNRDNPLGVKLFSRELCSKIGRLELKSTDVVNTTILMCFKAFSVEGSVHLLSHQSL